MNDNYVPHVGGATSEINARLDAKFSFLKIINETLASRFSLQNDL